MSHCPCARTTPQPDLAFDRAQTLDLYKTPAFDPADPESVSDLELDKRRDA